MERKSRLPLSNSSRLSVINSAPRRSRSSNTIPRGLQSTARSRSVTPSSAYGRQKSPLIKKDTRPLDNKKWQKNQTARVEAFVQQFEPTLKKLRPLSTNSFVTVLHYLMKAIDESFNISMANYKTELPDILKIFNYPTKLSPSVIKWPNTDHAYPAILGVWSFLLDKIEDSDVDLYQDIKSKLSQDNYEVADYLCKIGIKSYEQAAFTGAFHMEDIRTDIEHILIKNPKEHKMAEKELDTLHKKLNSAKEDVKKFDLELKDIVDVITRRKDTIQKHQEKMRETRNGFQNILKKLQDKRDILDTNIEHKTSELNQLHDKIDNIGVPKESINEMEQKIIESQHTNSLLKDRHEANMNKLTHLDLHLAQQKRQIECTVFGINNTFRDIRYLIDDKDQYVLPETGFTNSDYLQIIKDNDPTFFEKKLQNLEQDLKELSEKKEREIKTYEKKLMKLQSGHSDKLIAFKQYTKTLGKVKSELNNLEKQVEMLHCEIEEVSSSRIDLKHYINLNVEAQARKKKLVEALSEQDERIKEFLRNARRVSIENNCKLIKSMDNGIRLLNSQQRTEIDLINNLVKSTKPKLTQLKKLKESVEDEIYNSNL